ncbi:hypothetical protein TBLA_0D04510 [Henningerozyma blattae CBS 6284]|uniref:Uncharacterized protein n=1 Tax=Henningerozyma blattae (strain ATCC 34711 / CBS 6284 / DSM 70876 / NBRC 10599 / NRRL Y-10934 / UCD 77-7) TaxID=1071380 RepID=I2H3J5_HENB6|nr:hypothetical protein TBLA_0D04510 [Tetrapisispora blattae CBS 6284]CCH60947.1 hypothetical protein TBLA_0D04510 [Tetrapisispora blattae CBS 6284]
MNNHNSNKNDASMQLEDQNFTSSDNQNTKENNESDFQFKKVKTSKLHGIPTLGERLAEAQNVVNARKMENFDSTLDAERLSSQPISNMQSNPVFSQSYQLPSSQHIPLSSSQQPIHISNSQPIPLTLPNTQPFQVSNTQPVFLYYPTQSYQNAANIATPINQASTAVAQAVQTTTNNNNNNNNAQEHHPQLMPAPMVYSYANTNMNVDTDNRNNNIPIQSQNQLRNFRKIERIPQNNYNHAGISSPHKDIPTNEFYKYVNTNNNTNNMNTISKNGIENTEQDINSEALLRKKLFIWCLIRCSKKYKIKKLKNKKNAINSKVFSILKEFVKKVRLPPPSSTVDDTSINIDWKLDSIKERESRNFDGSTDSDLDADKSFNEVFGDTTIDESLAQKISSIQPTAANSKFNAENYTTLSANIVPNKRNFSNRKQLEFLSSKIEYLNKELNEWTNFLKPDNFNKIINVYSTKDFKINKRDNERVYLRQQEEIKFNESVLNIKQKFNSFEKESVQLNKFSKLLDKITKYKIELINDRVILENHKKFITRNNQVNSKKLLQVIANIAI